jgi:hypothetical protein
MQQLFTPNKLLMLWLEGVMMMMMMMNKLKHACLLQTLQCVASRTAFACSR